MPESKVATLLLVDDHVLFRDGLRDLISHWREFRVVGEAANGAEAVELCARLQPDIVLLDIRMPVMDGVETARCLRTESPATAVVMLTMSVEEGDLLEALKQGARGYILKNTSAQQLRERLHEVARGEGTLSSAIAVRILDEFKRQRSADAGSATAPTEALNEREVAILRLVAEGLSNEEIGARLFLSDQTVKKQLSSAMQKLHLNNRVQAAAYAVRHGLAG